MKYERTPADSNAEYWADIAAFDGRWDQFDQPAVSNDIASEGWREIDKRHFPRGSEDTVDRYDDYMEERDGIEDAVEELADDRSRS